MSLCDEIARAINDFCMVHYTWPDRIEMSSPTHLRLVGEISCGTASPGAQVTMVQGVHCQVGLGLGDDCIRLIAGAGPMAITRYYPIQSVPQMVGLSQIVVGGANSVQPSNGFWNGSVTSQMGLPKLEPVPTPPRRCECGAHAVKSNMHSNWCPLA